MPYMSLIFQDGGKTKITFLPIDKRCIRPLMNLSFVFCNLSLPNDSFPTMHCCSPLKCHKHYGFYELFRF